MSYINRYNTYWPYQSAIIKLLTFCLRTRFVVTINQINSILFAHLLPARGGRERERGRARECEEEAAADSVIHIFINKPQLVSILYLQKAT